MTEGLLAGRHRVFSPLGGAALDHPFICKGYEFGDVGPPRSS